MVRFFAPKLKRFVGRDAHIAPRIPDAEPIVPTRADVGIDPSGMTPQALRASSPWQGEPHCCAPAKGSPSQGEPKRCGGEGNRLPLHLVVQDEKGFAVPVSFLSGTPGYVETGSFTMPAEAVTVTVYFEVQGASYFVDVRTDHWFYDAVTFVTDRGYFRGIEETLFAPNMNMDRAMFVTVIGRIYGVDVSKYTELQECRGQCMVHAVRCMGS